jgi:hypothetical protein
MYHSRFLAPRVLLLALMLALAGYATVARGSFVPRFFLQSSQSLPGAPPATFSRELASHIGGTWGGESSAYSGYRQIVDNHNTISVRIPTEWNDFDTSTWIHKGQQVGVFTAASTNLDAFFSKSSESGVFVGVSRTLAELYEPDAVLDLERKDLARECTYGERYDYADPFYTGRYDIYTNCAEDGHKLLMVAAAPASREYMVVVRVVLQQPADLDATAHIFDTVQVIGRLDDSWGSAAAADLAATDAGATALANLYYCPLQ